MDAPEKSRFDLSQVDEADRHNLSATFLEAVQRFYDNPANRKRFENWQKQQNRDCWQPSFE